jgi:hypothetical protein
MVTWNGIKIDDKGFFNIENKVSYYYMYNKYNNIKYYPK